MNVWSHPTNVELVSLYVVNQPTPLIASPLISSNPATPTAAPQFISFSQTIRAEVGETVRLPCDVQSLGKRIEIYF